MRLKVGSNTYKVIYEEHPTVNDVQVWGYCHKDKKEIVLDKQMDQERTQSTLIHEILHAIIEERKLRRYLKDEEMLVDQLANGIQSVLRDNANLRRMLL